jgi:MFS transporter, AAHS family, 4-hydroxybenzoate transporter
MTQTSASSIETALENQRLGSLQIRVAALCTLIQMCDGYDVNSIGWAVPSLIHNWHLPPPAFTVTFLWSSIGIMIGALSAGPIGDRFGRRPLLLGSLAILGLASLLSAFAGSLGILSILRFFTGLGIGGAFPGAATLTADYAPRRLRATMIMASFTGAPIGGFLGGQLVALLLHQGFAWPVIFLIGGAFPLALVVVMALWLPESPRFLAARANLAPRERTLLQRLDIAPGQVERHTIDLARGNPIKMLFGEGYALQTILLWVIFFCSLLNLFLFAYWLPTVLNLIGFTPGQAVFASSLRDFGAIWAALYLGFLIDRVGADCPRRDALRAAAGGDLFLRHDHHRQPDRSQRDLRQALSGAHADQRPRLGTRHRPAGRHRRPSPGRISVGIETAADPHLLRRLPVCDRRRGIDRPACPAWSRHRASYRPAEINLGRPRLAERALGGDRPCWRTAEPGPGHRPISHFATQTNARPITSR